MPATRTRHRSRPTFTQATRALSTIGLGATCLLVLSARAGAQDSVPAGQRTGELRGVVTDTAGRPLADVEVLSLTAKRGTRSAADGSFTLQALPVGRQLVMARMIGFHRAEQVVEVLEVNTPAMTFALDRVAQGLDTVRVTSHDGCPPYEFAGFACRRRAGLGQFRGEDELKALPPLIHFADLLDGFSGVRRVPVRLGMSIESTVGWRCVRTGWNGRQETQADRIRVPGDIVAVEYYGLYAEVPAAYKRLAWPKGTGKPCGLVMLWTRGWVEHQKKLAAKRKP